MPAKSSRTSGGDACNLTGDGSNNKTFDAKTPRREEKQNPVVLRLYTTHPNRFPLSASRRICLFRAHLFSRTVGNSRRVGLGGGLGRRRRVIQRFRRHHVAVAVDHGNLPRTHPLGHHVFA